ncbi:MAG: ROK family protein [Acidimicrobiales bacterium]
MALALGLDVGGTKILGVAFDQSGAVLAECKRPAHNSREAVLDGLEEVAVELSLSMGEGVSELVGVGIGVPGLVDHDGVMHEAPNLPAAEELSVVPELARRLERRIPEWPAPRLIIDNDGTCAVAGEVVFGAGRGLSDVLMVALGTGIGGGIVSAGRVLRGGHGFAGEFGHMVVSVDGPLCVCGRFGCWEQFVSGSGHRRLAREAASSGRADMVLALAGGDVDKIESAHVFTAARSGDLEAWGIVDTIAKYLAIGIANLVEILDPLAVIIGGGAANDADLFLPATREYFEITRRGTGDRSTEIRQAELGPRAGAVGAGAMALGLIG